MASMQIKLLAFGPLREHLAADSVSLELPAGASVADLLEAAEAQYPALLPFRGRVAFARNATWCSAATLLAPGDEVALIPPVSGG
ncbi:MAG: MoaD/ThiS family protein [Planctomycetes bacterium]|nr:MoaD/ThiS family protein [Planctomycetota bacterium]